jgi:hypothetical protein
LIQIYIISGIDNILFKFFRTDDVTVDDVVYYLTDGHPNAEEHTFYARDEKEICDEYVNHTVFTQLDTCRSANKVIKDMDKYLNSHGEEIVKSDVDYTHQGERAMSYITTCGKICSALFHVSHQYHNLAAKRMNVAYKIAYNSDEVIMAEIYT